MRGGGRAERRRGEARAGRAGKRADDVEIGSDAVREDRRRSRRRGVRRRRAPSAARRAHSGETDSRGGRRGEALDDREGGANVQVTTAGVARVVAGRDDGEPRSWMARTSAKDNVVRARWRSAVAVADFGRRGERRLLEGRRRRARVVVIVGRVVGRVPAATTTRGQRRRRRRGERGEQGCERHGAERITRRGPGRAGRASTGDARRPWCPRARACPPDERDTLCRKRHAGTSEPEPRPERRGAKRRRCYLLDDLPRSNSRVS